MWDPPQKASPVSKHLGPLEIIPIEGIHDKSQQQTTWGVVYLCEFHVQRPHLCTEVHMFCPESVLSKWFVKYMIKYDLAGPGC